MRPLTAFVAGLGACRAFKWSQSHYRTDRYGWSYSHFGLGCGVFGRKP